MIKRPQHQRRVERAGGEGEATRVPEPRVETGRVSRIDVSRDRVDQRGVVSVILKSSGMRSGPTADVEKAPASYILPDQLLSAQKFEWSLR